MAPNVGLTGPLPSSLANVTTLATLWLNDNALNASLPAFLFEFAALSDILLQNNQYSGSLPGDIATPEATIALANFSQNFLDLCSTPSLAFRHVYSCVIGAYCTGCTLSWTGCTPLCIPAGPSSEVPEPISPLSPTSPSEPMNIPTITPISTPYVATPSVPPALLPPVLDAPSGAATLLPPSLCSPPYSS